MKTTTRKPKEIDVQLGIKIRNTRTIKGFTQESLAKAIGVTFQQVQKYERGTTRMSVSRLIDISAALDLDITYFFDKPSNDDGVEKKETMMTRDIAELIKHYSQIKNPILKKQIRGMAKALGE